MTVLIIPARKPRNPLVAAAHRRLAGKHGPQAGGRRRAASQALRQELRELPGVERGRPPSP